MATGGCMSKREWIKKIAVIIIGSVIAAYGITLALYAGFGGATLAVLWQGISGTFHVSIGAASFIVAVIMILFVLIYDRSQIHIGTILYQIVYSLCVDLFAQMHVYSKYMWLNMLIMLVGIVLFAVGTGLYAAADLGRGSYEAVTFALAEKNHWQVKVVRMILDAAMVVIGVILGGKVWCVYGCYCDCIGADNSGDCCEGEENHKTINFPWQIIMILKKFFILNFIPNML